MIVIGKLPSVPDAAVPARVAVPLPLSLNVMPVGSAPDSVIAAVGLPVVVTENDPAVPTVKVAAPPLVMAGACRTVIVSVCWTEPYALVAVSGTAYVPAVVGVPDRVPVPLPLSVKVTPGGRLDQPRLGAGDPLVVTVKLNAVPAVPVALLALVNAGASPTTTVMVWVASGLIPLLAVMVSWAGAGGGGRARR